MAAGVKRVTGSWRWLDGEKNPLNEYRHIFAQMTHFCKGSHKPIMSDVSHMTSLSSVCKDSGFQLCAELRVQGCLVI